VDYVNGLAQDHLVALTLTRALQMLGLISLSHGDGNLFLAAEVHQWGATTLRQASWYIIAQCAQHGMQRRGAGTRQLACMAGLPTSQSSSSIGKVTKSYMQTYKNGLLPFWLSSMWA